MNPVRIALILSPIVGSIINCFRSRGGFISGKCLLSASSYKSLYAFEVGFHVGIQKIARFTFEIGTIKPTCIVLNHALNVLIKMVNWFRMYKGGFHIQIISILVHLRRTKLLNMFYDLKLAYLVGADGKKLYLIILILLLQNRDDMRAIHSKLLK